MNIDITNLNARFHKMYMQAKVTQKGLHFILAHFLTFSDVESSVATSPDAARVSASPL